MVSTMWVVLVSCVWHLFACLISSVDRSEEFKANGADLMKLPGASRGLLNTDTRSSRLRRIGLREVPPLCSCEQDGRMTVRYKPYHIEKGHPVTKALQACGAKNWQRQERFDATA